jgi:hypothetical protein
MIPLQIFAPVRNRDFNSALQLRAASQKLDAEADHLAALVRMS